jgi:hippurate hydrolase
MKPVDRFEEVVRWRHHLHRHPELGFQERKTSAFIAQKLTDWGLTVQTGLAGTGVVGTLSRGLSRRTIGIRADIDALPILEASDISHRSLRPGVMHACGHDGHTAILLAAARECAAHGQFDGTVHFIFQPAEENEGGARAMVEQGLFRQFPVDAVYALHNWPALTVGTCFVGDDAMMAAFATFEIKVQGKGAHGGMPHEGHDPVVAASQIVCALQTIASRNVAPLESSVVTVTQVHAGDAWNVIPEMGIIRGTTRWFDTEVGELIERRIGKIATRVAEAFDCTAEIAYTHRYPATINHKPCAEFVRSVLDEKRILACQDAKPSMAAEDFAFMLREVPGAYVWLGAGKPGENPGLHSPYFDFNDDVIPLGIELWEAVISSALRPE